VSHAALADAIVLVHLAFVVFVVGGGLLALRWPRAAWLHLPALAWGAFIELTGRVCPLTPLENRLRAEAGGGTYQTGFVEHHLVPVLYPPGLGPRQQLWLGAALLAWSALVYALVLRRVRRDAAGRDA
jgi:hypothetical protein